MQSQVTAIKFVTVTQSRLVHCQFYIHIRLADKVVAEVKVAEMYYNAWVSLVMTLLL